MGDIDETLDRCAKFYDKFKDQIERRQKARSDYLFAITRNDPNLRAS